MPEQVPSPGRIVHYRLSRADCVAVSRRRKDAHTHMAEHRENATGVQVHVGNVPFPGDVVPLLVVRASTHGVNGQAFLDGNDALWITAATQGDGNGFWDWPERVGA